MKYKNFVLTLITTMMAMVAQAEFPNTALFNYTLVGTPGCPGAVATATFEKTLDYTRFRVDVYNISCAPAIDYYVNGKLVASRQTHDGHADLGMDTRFNNTIVPLMGPDALIEVRLHESDALLLTDRPQDPPAEGEGEGEGDVTTGEGEGEGDATTGEGEGEGDVTTGEGEGEGEAGGAEGEGETGGNEGEGEGEVTGGTEGEGEGEGQTPPSTAGLALRQTAGKNGYYYPGQDLLVRIRVRAEHPELLAAFGISETLPDGWLVTDLVNDAGAAIKPAAGDGGTVSFAWITVPTFPVELAYHVSVPADATGNYAITGEALYRLSDSAQLTTGLISTAVVPGVSTEHCTTADTDHDWNISLSEVLRLVQLYNSGQFHCDATGEDGFAPGAGDQMCTLHNSDHLSPDFKIELSELLRLVQFYNAADSAYHVTQGTEDGFSPGDATN